MARVVALDVAGEQVVLRTDEGPDGYGRAPEGVDWQALAPHVVGRHAPERPDQLVALRADLAGADDAALAAVVNAAWDLAARRAGVPLWRFLAGLSPEEVVALVDFAPLSGLLTREEALDILRRAEPTRAERTAILALEGLPAVGDDDHVLPLDASGVDGNLALLLLAAKSGVPVRGVHEWSGHLSAFDYVAVSGADSGGVGDRYRAPTEPGLS
ncbi:hypothetical protein [Actinosynnema sp. NPDC020468]|uniref:hypothetical protein n=1 Tax=Actinosynnema sp. NPDC020468 TaxID=3154488 RepID=UPI0034010A53